MSNINNLPPNKKDGLYRGELHNDPETGEALGGIQSIIDGVKKVEIESDEYMVCRSAMESQDIYEFKQKTNKQILDKLFREEGCIFSQGTNFSGDFIACRLVVLDDKKHDRKGTVKEILNQMQSEKACRMTSDAQQGLAKAQMATPMNQQGGKLNAEDQPTQTEITEPVEEIGYGAGIAIVMGDSILLTHPTKSRWQKSYSIPKGKMDAGEVFFQTAVRETNEEVGIVFSIEQMKQIKDQFPVIINYVKKKGVQTKLAYYVLRINDLSEIGLTSHRVPQHQLQIEEVDWAGFVKFEEAKATRLVPLQVQIVEAIEANTPKGGARGLMGADGFMLAPNGKKSNLTPEQWRLVRTPEFKAWFGDFELSPETASKVVDENGEPLAVWHGTSQDFNVFEHRSNHDIGIHFGTLTAGNQIAKGRAKILRGGKEVLKPFFLNLRNPVQSPDMQGDEVLSEWVSVIHHILPKEEAQELGNKALDEIGYDDIEEKEAGYYRDYLLKKGIDGIKYKNENEDVGSISWIAFLPEQIKLADGTNTTFDSSNPDIRMEAGGTAEAQIDILQAPDGLVVDAIVKQLKTKYVDKVAEITNLPIGTDLEKAKQREAVIEWITNPKDDVKIILAFSGGKDSVAMVLYCLFVLKIPKERIELWHHDVDGHGEQLFDWACTPSYCEAFAKAFGLRILFSYADGGILREIYRTNETVQPVYFQKEPTGSYTKLNPRGLLQDKNTRRMFPAVNADLQTRWCSWIAKIGVMRKVINNWDKYNNSNVCILTGERRQESTARSKYDEIEKSVNASSTRRVLQWRPIIEWSEKEVWAIMEKHFVQPHPCYELGWGRCSCQLCIFSSANTWASINEISPEKVKRIAEIEKDLNHTLYNEFEKVPTGKFWKSGKNEGQEMYAKGKKLDSVMEARVARGKSFISQETKDKWMAEALGEFKSPIIVREWKLPAGAFNGETSGAN